MFLTYTLENLSSAGTQADAMARYIEDAADGDYLAFSVVFDGKTNVNDNLRQALHSLGSVLVDSLEPGHAWLLITRKGFGPEYLREQWSPEGIVEDAALHRSVAEEQLRVHLRAQEEDPPPPGLARSRREPSVRLVHQVAVEPDQIEEPSNALPRLRPA